MTIKVIFCISMIFFLLDKSFANTSKLDQRQESLLIYVQFNSGSVSLDDFPQNKRILNRVRDKLLESPELRIRIFGYSDEIGSPEFNTWLSLERARVSAEYLISQGISIDRIDYYGAENQLFEPDGTAFQRSRNRTITIEQIE